LLAAIHVGTVQNHATVEATGPKKGRIQNVRPVGGGNDNHIGVGIKAIHLDEYLVKSLFSLIVGAAKTSASMAAYRIDLIHKDDAGRIPLGLVKKVPDAAGTDADKHLDEL
jgi:hypothetical protein